MKNKLDTLFLKIISDRALNLDKEDLNKVSSVGDGLSSNNKQIKAIAEILTSINKNVEQQRMELRIRNKAEEVSVDESDLKALYRKILPILN